MPYTYEEIKNNKEILNIFKSRDCFEMYCTRCQKILNPNKKKILRALIENRTGVFCDNSCYMSHKYKDSVQYLKCGHCDKEVRRTPSQICGKVFCSQSCAAKINNQGKRRHPPRNCKKCQKQYITTGKHKSLKLCIDCKATLFTTEQAKNMSIKEYTERESVKNKHPSWRFNHIRNFNRSWNKDLVGKPCQVCNYSVHTELAHIKAISDFPEDEKLGIINDPSNILVLCPNHHWEFDKGILLLENIPARN